MVRTTKPEDARTWDPGPDEIAKLLSRDGLGVEPEHGARPGEARPVEWVQTHISHVFLTADRVYKLRKSVRQPFLDFSTRAARNLDCLREVSLNRRLAPDVYLGIAPILTPPAAARIGPVHESVERSDLEHVVVMRRLPARRDALALLEDGQLTPEQLERVAVALARFHGAGSLGRPAPWSRSEWFERTAEPVLECLRALEHSEAEIVSTPRAKLLEMTLRDRLEALRPRLEARRLEGRAVDAHGDLHLDHVWFETDEAAPLMIDCLEFNEDLRQIDTASELAFLTMDLQYRGRADLAEGLLSTYAAESDDYGLFGVVDFFAAYRALVRAKVAALTLAQDTIENDQRARARKSCEAHLRLAEELLETSRMPELILLCGTVGSGKSTVGRELARSGAGIQIASDRVRKRLAGIAPTARSGDETDEGLYRPEQTEAVYRALLERAAPVLDSGRSAILDASFSRRVHRDQARRWARARGHTVRLVEIRCSQETAAKRLRERERAGRDPSDAGPDFLPISLARYEPPDEWPKSTRVVVWTDRRATPDT